MANVVHRSLSSLFLGVTFFVGTFSVSEARNGFIPHYVGLEGVVSGAGTAYRFDALSTIANPAALTGLPTHFVATVGAMFQNQHVNMTKAAFGNPIGDQKNQFKNFPVGSIGFNYNINRCWSVGFALTGGGGFAAFRQPLTNPAFLTPAPGHYDKYTVHVVGLTATTLAYQPTPSQSYGISLLVGTSDFRSNLALPLPGGFPFAEVKGHKHWNFTVGAGVRAGFIWDLGKYLTVGASGASPVFFNRHNKYKQLFKHKFQIPATARVGIAVHLNSCVDVLFDYKELFYGEAKWVRKDEKWRNQVIFLTGIVYKVTKELMLGLGYNYAKVPFKNNAVYLNGFSIPLEEHHISGGFNYKLDNEKKELFLLAFYIPQKKMTDNGKGLPGGISKGIKLKGSGWGFELGGRINF